MNARQRPAGGVFVVMTLHAMVTCLLVVIAAAASPKGHNIVRSEGRTAAKQTSANVPASTTQENERTGADFAGIKVEEHVTVSQTIATWVQALAAVASLALSVWVIHYSRKAWKAADKSANAATAAANAAGEANQINREFTIADQRPWVSLDVQLAGPIAKHPHTGDGLVVPLRLRIRNHGKTPATHVDTHARLMPSILGYEFGDTPDHRPKPLTDVGSWIEAIGQGAKVFAGMDLGHVLFPGEPPAEWGWTLEFPKTADNVHEAFCSQFVVVTCVTYSSTIDPGTHHRTAKTFRLWKKVGDQRIPYCGEELALEDIGFVLDHAPNGASVT
jgi:hypothetical protein